MRFTVGGGVHEHGRNCFFVESDTNYIVDCGIMHGDISPYPHLSNEQIKSAKYLFLTHMHEDHIGAFTWLVNKGFCGLAVFFVQSRQIHLILSFCRRCLVAALSKV